MCEKVILQIQDLTKKYDDDINGKEVLKNMNLIVNENEFLCILGPSGCGKSTLLRCIAGFEKYNGTIKANGDEQNQPGVDRFMVFQDFNQLFPWKTVIKNVMYPLSINSKSAKKEIQLLALESLKKVGLEDYAEKYPHQLSGGMKQRVAIAKALALKSPIILMDEPFAALDAMTRSGLQKELLNIAGEENRTIIFITHNIQEAIILGTRIIVLGQQGQILCDKKNSLQKPVTPASPGYGVLWEELHQALYDGVYHGQHEYN